MRHDPKRGELLFRFWFSLAGLVLVGVAVVARGIANSAALVEVIGIAGLFFGGTAVWTGLKLLKQHSDDS
jgi:hypothetical protein